LAFAQVDSITSRSRLYFGWPSHCEDGEQVSIFLDTSLAVLASLAAVYVACEAAVRVVSLCQMPRRLREAREANKRNEAVASGLVKAMTEQINKRDDSESWRGDD
jgi:hypothetical protein